MDRKTSVFFLTVAYNPRKKSTWGDLSSFKVMRRAVSMGGVAELWGRIVTRPPCAETARRKKARGMDSVEGSDIRIRYQNGCGQRWHSVITSVSVKRESHPTGSLSWEGHQEQ